MAAKKKQQEPLPEDAQKDVEKKDDTKSRHWVGVWYPESLPEGWEEIMNMTFVAWARSPLHDKDLNEDGTPKKPHYHIIISFDGPTTYKNVARICKEFNQPIPQKCESVKGAYDYFTHKNNPEKYQYDKKDIKVYNGFEIVLSNHEINNIVSALTDIVFERKIHEYADLIYYAKYVLYDEDYANIAAKNTIYFNALCRSLRHKARDEAKKAEEEQKSKFEGEIVDEETGEIKGA